MIFSDILSEEKKLSTVFMQNNERNGPWVDQKRSTAENSGI